VQTEVTANGALAGGGGGDGGEAFASGVRASDMRLSACVAVDVPFTGDLINVRD